MQSPKPSTSQRPWRVPPQGPLRWFLAHCDSGHRNAMSGSEQSPQSRHWNNTALLTCSSARMGLGPCMVSFALAQSFSPHLVNGWPGLNIRSCVTLDNWYTSPVCLECSGGATARFDESHKLVAEFFA